jgi:plasmid maintenance system antidote protein VapI
MKTLRDRRRKPTHPGAILREDVIRHSRDDVRAVSLRFTPSANALRASA